MPELGEEGGGMIIRVMSERMHSFPQETVPHPHCNVAMPFFSSFMAKKIEKKGFYLPIAVAGPVGCYDFNL